MTRRLGTVRARQRTAYLPTDRARNRQGFEDPLLSGRIRCTCLSRSLRTCRPGTAPSTSSRALESGTQQPLHAGLWMSGSFGDALTSLTELPCCPGARSGVLCSSDSPPGRQSSRLCATSCVGCIIAKHLVLRITITATTGHVAGHRSLSRGAIGSRIKNQEHTIHFFRARHELARNPYERYCLKQLGTCHTCDLLMRRNIQPLAYPLFLHAFGKLLSSGETSSQDLRSNASTHKAPCFTAGWHFEQFAQHAFSRQYLMSVFLVGRDGKRPLQVLEELAVEV